MEPKDYQKAKEILQHFPNYEVRYNRSALFHQVIQMLVRTDDPYLIIDNLITLTEDTQKAFETYMIDH
jgi:hypothetical protein